MMFGAAIIPAIAALIWLVALVYGLVLGTRFVEAVEKIATSMERRP